MKKENKNLILIDDVKVWDKNPREISPKDFESLKKKIDRWGIWKPFLVWESKKQILGGNSRYKACKELGHKEIWVEFREPKDDAEALEMAIADNESSGEWIKSLLIEQVKLNESKIDLKNYKIDIKDSLLLDLLNPYDNYEGKEKLTDKFVVPPFSILDGRQGYWQKRKKMWLSKGIKSELGREDLENTSASTAINRGNDDGGSIFDPLLCEIMYKWFCLPKGNIIDCFAGGSVRGVMASLLGYQYYGVDLSENQIKANREQADLICSDKVPVWQVGDSVNIETYLKDVKGDFLFSCPPYFDLELYSDSKSDLSNMEYDEFLVAYKKIIASSVSLLNNNRFACFVVGDIRDKNGAYRNFVSDTINCFIEAGMSYYNEAIFVTPLGSLPIRISAQFSKNRKLGKAHQNVLIFYKGNIGEMNNELGLLDISEENL